MLREKQPLRLRSPKRRSPPVKNPQRRNKLLEAYRLLSDSFGPRHWWPAETPFEVMVGAILTQNTNWKNVEKAIENLKKAQVLSPQKLYNLPPTTLAKLIQPAGYFRVKAKRLRHFLKYFLETYGGDVKKMEAGSLEKLRAELLGVNGIGPETADSILLYALNKPIFVIDAYTKRVLNRHGLCAEDDGYEELQNIFMDNLKPDVSLYNEYHALVVEVGKEFCRTTPKCSQCPLNGWNWEKRR
ncbi:MAG: endonuclease III domain-containing protein [Deltaproteobacteria bacterium]|nr:endonuclease III domain-containing protein [Deltaproteobacteria bacterium]